jgi:hypothetical protein
MAGRPKNIETPEILWNLFVAYRDWIKLHPILKHDFVGKDANEVERRLERPLTFVGFESFLDEQGVIAELKDYEANKEQRYTEFAPIIARIKRCIETDQFEGASVGIYQHNIIARKLGLVDKVESKSDVKVTNHVDLDTVSTEDLAHLERILKAQKSNEPQ